MPHLAHAASFLNDDSPPESPERESAHSDSDEDISQGAAYPPDIETMQTATRVDMVASRARLSRHDSPFTTPTKPGRQTSLPPLDTGYFPQVPRGRHPSRFSLRSLQPDVQADDQPVVPILVHLRTNVVVREEFKLVMALSSCLSQLYSCAKDAIMINVDHSVCLMLGTSFDPAYFLHIQTLPAHVDRTTNSRAAADIQAVLHRHLHVPPARGMVRFQPISPDFVATSSTLFSQIPQQATAPQRPHSTMPYPHQRARSASLNPVLPPMHGASAILDGQIASMSEAGSVRAPSVDPATRREYSPTRDWHGPDAARRYRSENLRAGNGYGSASEDEGDDLESFSEASSTAEPPPPIAQKREVASKRRSIFSAVFRRS